MSEGKMVRLSQAAKKLNVGIGTIAEHLNAKGFDVVAKPNTKITQEQYQFLEKEFESSKALKEEALEVSIGGGNHESLVLNADQIKKDDPTSEEDLNFVPSSEEEAAEPPKQKTEENKKEKAEKEVEAVKEKEEEESSYKLRGLKVVNKIDLKPKKKEQKEEKNKKEEVKKKPEAVEEPKVKKEEKDIKKKEKVEGSPVEEKKEENTPAIKEGNAKKNPPEAVEEQGEIDETIEAKADKLKGLKVLGKIELPKDKEKQGPVPVASSDEKKSQPKKRKRVRIYDNKKDPRKKDNKEDNKKNKKDVSQKEVQQQYKKTLAKLGSGGGKTSKSKYKRERRSARAEEEAQLRQRNLDNAKILKVTEFISANELATLMDTNVNKVISKCMSLGLFVSINQRLDAETITIIADEFGYKVEFTTNEEESELILEEEDKAEDLKERPPVVTIMGHVDHGKTSLLDYIRSANVAEGEAGGITQHIGAYDVTTKSGRRIAFLDTPGHEAFTAMRARGAKLTDVAIIVIAADDSIMPQTREAINHAQIADVPIVIAINKIDKPGANPNKIKEELANINILVEEWGGKYQSYEISAKKGIGIDDLLEGLLLESDVLELKANPNKKANGTVVEASLDKGRGYVTTMLIQTGTMRVGDIILAGQHHGRVKAMTDHRGKKMKEAGPSTPVQVLGLNGAPQAGDKVNVLDTEREAREIANKRQQITREQSIRATKRTTLSDIGRRIAVGNFQQLKIVLKGDVDGSVEALSDSLLKLSTEQIEIDIIHKAVGPISESDVLLASASDAIIIGFQVRPTPSAKKLAEKEEIELRLYSVIYNAIDEVKLAMEGMLAPEFEEVIAGNVEIREVFKISKVGTVAGCYVTDGYIKRNSKIRIIRDGIVIYGGEKPGEIDALKRFKDDVSEVKHGYECGISIKGYNDIREEDVIEVVEEREIARK